MWQGLSKYSRILAGGLEEPPQSIADAHYGMPPSIQESARHATALLQGKCYTGTGQTGSNAAEPKHSRSNVNFSKATAEPANQHAHAKKQAVSAAASLEAALSRISDAGNRPGGKVPSTSCSMKSTMKSTMRSTIRSVQPASHATMQHATARQMSRLKSTRQLEVEQAEGAERIKAHNLHTAMQPLKQVLYQIDESGSGRMSYHDFYLFLERTSPHMLPAASSIFFTLDRRMDGEVRYKDILRVLYPHALDKELAEMLSVVIPKKHVKGQNNLEQQVAELKEVFAVYDEDGTGQLNQATFVEAIVSAGYEREEAVQMFDIVDADHGGSVSLEEFMDWYLHNETGKDKTGINNQASLAMC
ncbi:TPA: hypothetical protein ACH3X3_007097 [Trebouxia sp. C0006]